MIRGLEYLPLQGKATMFDSNLEKKKMMDKQDRLIKLYMMQKDMFSSLLHNIITKGHPMKLI